MQARYARYIPKSFVASKLVAEVTFHARFARFARCTLQAACGRL